MQCPQCGAPVLDDDVFCGACGATIAPAAQPTVPLTPAEPEPAPAAYTPQPTQVMPQVPAQPTYPPAQQPYPGAQPYPPAQQPYPGAQPAPPAKSNTTLFVVLGIVAFLLVAGLAVGGFFGWRAYTANRQTQTATEQPAAQPPAAGEEGSSAEDVTSGYATPEEALATMMPGDWVSMVYSEEAERIVYAIGPPASEYVSMVEVMMQSDGTWIALEPYPIDTGDYGGETLSPEDEALQVVGEFIYAVKEDRAEDAHALTISPFSEDAASAQYSDGQLTSFEITDSQLQGDGSTVWVWSSEQWAWGTESWIYVCTPTPDGYRISDLRIP